tara:strand:+ start:267 stop:1007 length:741 start_codon:yes stop_codon:yes gene_type:complete
MNQINITPKDISRIFWELIYGTEENFSPLDRANLLNTISKLDILRYQEIADESSQAEVRLHYNETTGSTTPAQAIGLYYITKYFRPLRVIEIGTWIGKSTVSIASAIDTYSQAGEIVTCDVMNDIKIPFEGKTKITQFPKQDSNQMLQQLSGTYDLVFIDGKIMHKDIPLLKNLITPKTIFVIDDFEGLAKGVENVSILRDKIDLLKSHYLIMPPNEKILNDHRFKTTSTTAVIVPMKTFTLAVSH